MHEFDMFITGLKTGTKSKLPPTTPKKQYSAMEQEQEQTTNLLFSSELIFFS